MEYKVLIKLYVPEIEETYEFYIPINKKIGEKVKELCKIVSELSKIYPKKENIHLCNRYTGSIYKFNQTIRESDIRNGSELVMF